MIGIELGNVRAQPDLCDVVIASVFSLGRQGSGSRLLKYDPREFQCIIVDEAHHAVASTYMNIFKHFNIIRSENTENNSIPAGNPPIFLWGCSATVKRSDCVALKLVFQQIVYHLPVTFLIEKG